MSETKINQVMSPYATADYSNFSCVPFLKDGNWIEFSTAIKVHFQVNNIWKAVQYASLQEYLTQKFSSFLPPLLSDESSTVLATNTSSKTKQTRPPKEKEPESDETVVEPSKKATGTEKSRSKFSVDSTSIKMSDLSDWDAANNKAFGKLMARLPVRLQEEFSKHTNAHYLWLSLESRFHTNLEVFKENLIVEYHAIKMQEQESLVQYLDRVSELTRKLELHKEPQSEKSICLKVIGTILPKYDPIRQTYLTLPSEHRTLRNLRNQFLQQDVTFCAPTQARGLAADTTHCLGKDCTNIPRTGHKWCSKCFSKKNNSNGSSTPSDSNSQKCVGCDGQANSGFRWCQKCYDAKYAKKKNQQANPTANPATTYNLCTVTTLASKVHDSNYYMDSGASRHMTNRSIDVQDIQSSDGTRIHGATGSKSTPTDGIGCIQMKGKNATVQYNDVLVAKNINNNLLSVSTIDKKGAWVLFGDGQVTVTCDRPEIKRTDSVIATGTLLNNGLYAMDESVIPASIPALTVTQTMTLQQLHERMGHAGKHKLRSMVNSNLLGDVKITDIDSVDVKCTECDLGKLKRTKFNKQKGVVTTEVGEVVHSDVCGPINPATMAGTQYFVSFIDDFSRYSWVYFMKHKSEVFSKFRLFEAELELHHQKKVKTLHSDGGGEYLSNVFKLHLESRGIHHKFSPPYTPQTKGIAERFNRTIMDMVRPMMRTRRVQKPLWAEAVKFANFIRNRLTTKITGKSPISRLSGNESMKISDIHTFGCKVVYKDNTEKEKLQDRGIIGTYLGYDDIEHYHRVFDSARQQTVITRDVSFYESDSIENEIDLEYFKDLNQEPLLRRDHVIDLEIENRTIPIAKLSSERQDIVDQDPTAPTVVNSMEHPFVIEDDDDGDSIDDRRERRMANAERQERSQRDTEDFMTRKLIPFNEANALSAMEAVIDPDTPRSLRDVNSSDRRDEWLEAILAEIESLERLQVFEIVDSLPDARKAVGSKVVYKLKRDATGKIDKYKARIVAKGYSQQKGIDFHDTFSPVARYETIRYLLAYSVENELVVELVDVNTAFLNSELHEEIYLELPEEYRHFRNGKYCRLKKALYGLKQASMEWFSTLVDFLSTKGFQQSSADQCLHFGSGSRILCHFVDDIILVGTKESILGMKKDLKSKFDIKELGDIKSLLGIDIRRMEGKMMLGQEYYTNKILEKFGMSDCKQMSTPCDSFRVVSDDEEKFEDRELFQSALGCLTYLTMTTRPDIAFAVNQAAKGLNDPKQSDWTRVKRIMRYLKGTAALALTFSKESSPKIVGYCDASFAEDGGRKSTTGYFFTASGGAISWRSKKQEHVTISTTESELIALSDAMKEAMWLRRFELQIHTSPTVIFQDNQSAIMLQQNRAHSHRTKHMDLRYLFGEEKVTLGIIELKYLETANMPADTLTKPLLRVAFERHRKSMGLF